MKFFILILILSAALPSFVLYRAMITNDPILYSASMFGTFVFFINIHYSIKADLIK